MWLDHFNQFFEKEDKGGGGGNPPAKSKQDDIDEILTGLGYQPNDHEFEDKDESEVVPPDKVENQLDEEIVEEEETNEEEKESIGEEVVEDELTDLTLSGLKKINEKEKLGIEISDDAGWGHFLTIDRNRRTAVKLDLNVSRFIRSIFG